MEQDEGNVPSAYQDSEGYWTIGVGRLIDARKGGGLSDEEVQFLLTNDIEAATRTCHRLYPLFYSFTNDQQDALINMAFNLGFKGLVGFHKMNACIHQGDWAGAAREAKDSKWHSQVKARADRIIAKFTKTTEAV